MPTAPSRRVTPAHATPLAEQARESLRASILDGSLEPGERLTIEALALELGISRTPVREALKALEQEGLVRLLPHRGAVVEAVALDEVHHRMAIRAMLEGYAAELACLGHPERIGDHLTTICDQSEALASRVKLREPTVRRLSALNREFHAAIRDGSGSETLKRLLVSLQTPAAFSYSHWSDPAGRHASLESHRGIADAFVARKPRRARTLMERHLLETRDLSASRTAADA